MAIKIQSLIEFGKSVFRRFNSNSAVKAKVLLIIFFLNLDPANTFSSNLKTSKLKSLRNDNQ